MNISKDAAFVSVSMKLWTGRATLPSDTQTLVDGVAIPDEIKRDGTIAIYDPALLRMFQGLKSRLVRTMQAHTLKFMGGYIMDAGRVDALTKDLEALRDKFNATVQDFAGMYPMDAKAWVDTHPSCAALIASKQPARIEDRFAFKWNIYRLDPIGGSAEDDMDSLGDEAITDLAQEIAAVYKNTFLNSKSRNFTQPLNTLIKRCDVLAFTTPYVGTVGEVLRALVRLPKREVCAAVLSMLAEPASLQSFCDAVKEVGSCDGFSLVGIVNSMGPGVTPAAAEPVEEAPAEEPAQATVSVDDMCAFLDSGGLY